MRQAAWAESLCEASAVTAQRCAWRSAVRYGSIAYRVHQERPGVFESLTFSRNPLERVTRFSGLECAGVAT